MPFQGNKDNSAQILQFLASQRQQRIENERRDKALQQQQMATMLQARAKTRDEQRKAETHALEVQQKQFELAKLREEALGEAAVQADAAEAAVPAIAGDIASDTSTPLGQQVSAVTGEGVFGKGAGVFARGPEAEAAAAGDVEQAARQRAFEPTNSLLGLAGVEAGRRGDVLNIQNAKQSVLIAREEAEARREEARRRDAAWFDARLAAGSSGRETASLMDKKFDLEDKLASLNPGTKEYDRARERLNATQNQIFKKLNAGIGDSAIVIREGVRQDIANLQVAQSQLGPLEQFLAMAEQNPNFVGYTGQAADLMQFFFESQEDFMATGTALLEGVWSDPNTSQETLAALESLGLDPRRAQASSDTEILSSLMAFSLVRAMNPNRFAQAQVEEMKQFTNFRRGTASSAIRRMKTTAAALRSTISDAEKRVEFALQLNSIPDTGFTTTDQTGRKRLDIPQGSPIPFSSLEGVNSPNPGQFNETDPRGAPSAASFLELSEEEQAAAIDQILQEQGN